MKAMVLAAGFGKRLRPITLDKPKPLVRVADRTLLDRALDQLALGGVREAVVNAHYLGDQIIAHADASNHAVSIQISDERDQVLETAGGIIRALPSLGTEPFISINADTFWVDGPGGASAIKKLIDVFDADTTDILLLVCKPKIAIGHSGGIDFEFADDSKLTRASDEASGYTYAGVAMLHPRIFDGAVAKPHSLNVYFDRAIEAGRLRGVELTNAFWYTVSTPQSLMDVEAHLRANGDMPI
ncbi:MAG: nucleotidyltransferase family protein [Pseudomonadota bacterium]